MNVRLISVTQPVIPECKTAEELIMYCARVSNPKAQDSHKIGLLKYCIDNGHWSIFNQACMSVEVVTSRAISAQILRHWSLFPQEFSQRYAEVVEFENVELRLQGDNKQGGSEVVEDECIKSVVDFTLETCQSAYKTLVGCGVSRETARMILPMCSQTKLYLNGTVRSWIHYLQVRLDDHTQKEHRLIAEEIKKIFVEQFPNIAEVMRW